jgi:hypothetical protein
MMVNVNMTLIIFFMMVDMTISSNIPFYILVKLKKLPTKTFRIFTKRYRGRKHSITTTKVSVFFIPLIMAYPNASSEFCNNNISYWTQAFDKAVVFKLSWIVLMVLINIILFSPIFYS